MLTVCLAENRIASQRLLDFSVIFLYLFVSVRTPTCGCNLSSHGSVMGLLVMSKWNDPQYCRLDFPSTKFRLKKFGNWCLPFHPGVREQSSTSFLTLFFRPHRFNIFFTAYDFYTVTAMMIQTRGSGGVLTWLLFW